MNSLQKKILIAAFRDVSKSKRVLRQIYYLKDKYDLYVIGYEPSININGIKYFQVIPRFRYMSLYQKVSSAFILGIRQFEAAHRQLYGYQDAIRKLSPIQFDLILAHDFKPLPMIYQLNKNPNILVDIHEYYFDMSNKRIRLISRFDDYLISTYFLRCDKGFTVSQGIAEEYKNKSGKNFQVITSAHDYVECQPSSVMPDKIRIIHHGNANSDRKLERMIQVMDNVDKRFELDLMLTALTFDMPYLKSLQKMADSRKNVRLLPPVASKDIVTFTSQYDIGFFLLPETNFSLKYSLPNKFFEFIQARLCIAIGPSVEMAKIVKKYDLGIVAEDFNPNTMANMLNALTEEQIMYHKQQCHRFAHELSSEKEMVKLGCIIKNSLSTTKNSGCF